MSEKIRILYIDDDFELSEMAEEYLSTKGLEVSLFHDPNTVIEALKNTSFDLCLMDVKMPQKDGFTLAEELVREGIDTPFLFLTGQTRKEDRIKGLKLGAEDYISKPFSLEELYLRIINIVKRAKKGSEKPKSEYQLGNALFKVDYHELRVADQSIHLSTTESKLLLILCQNMNQPVSRTTILMSVWGEDDHYKSLSLNVYITRLRKHFKANDKVAIINEHGQGYKLILEH